jgi:hypothetical protein
LLQGFLAFALAELSSAGDQALAGRTGGSEGGLTA